MVKKIFLACVCHVGVQLRYLSSASNLLCPRGLTDPSRGIRIHIQAVVLKYKILTKYFGASKRMAYLNLFFNSR